MQKNLERKMCDLCFVVCFTFHISLSIECKLLQKMGKWSKDFLFKIIVMQCNASTYHDYDSKLLFATCNVISRWIMLLCRYTIHIYLWNEWIIDKSKFPIPWEKSIIKPTDRKGTHTQRHCYSVRTWLLKF